MDIEIRNCNNIDEAKISIEPGRLNIKYGPNGTGKSTIAKAIELSARSPSDLSKLTPFKHRGAAVADDQLPLVKNADSFKLTAIFNDDYVNQFVFRQDEVIKDSFEVFIRNELYDQKMSEIESIVSDIKNAYAKNAAIDQVIKDLYDLSDSFGKSKTGYSKAGRIGKGLGNGNKVENIPEKLVPYSDLIKSESNVKWIKWQIDGNEFLNISSSCPYCTSPTDDKKDTILAVKDEYDAKSIEHLNALQGIISRLGKYFSEETIGNIEKIFKNKDGLKKEEETYLVGLKGQVDTFREKLNDIKGISFFSLRDVDKVQAKITSLKIDLSLLPGINSDESNKISNEVNASIDAVLGKAGILQGEINKQKKGIEATINMYKKEINSFLQYAGYKYEIDILPDGDAYKMKLKHRDFSGTIESGGAHLSYGERNAFSIVLFMYDCLTKNPDLIILDDPISSFDKTKKFAILEMLFRGSNSFRGRTVLMLTHDIEPIIDMVRCLGHIFEPVPSAAFLKARSGSVSEMAISKQDVSSFGQICEENIRSLNQDLIKVIYLRRYYEILNEKGLEYQLISSLLHKRQNPTVQDGSGSRAMTTAEVNLATVEIRKKFASFDYDALLGVVSDPVQLKSLYASSDNNYEKLQIYRLMNDDGHDSDVIRKYINETYHIENEYVMQLNPHKYDPVPDHIIEECDRSLK